MKSSSISGGAIPAYHPDQVLLKLRPGAVESLELAGAAPAMFTAAARSLPGLSALHRLERGGQIRRVTPLSPRAELAASDAGPSHAFASLAAAARPVAKPDANAGVSLVELEHGADPDALCQELAADPEVEAASRVPVRYWCARRRRADAPAAAGATAPAATPPISPMWNLARIRWAEARTRPGFQDANAVRVAVLDTGIDAAHPDLAAAVKHYVYAHPHGTAPSGPKDYIGHGTHVAGTIAATIGNELGINGVCACEIHAWKIFDDEPDYYGGYFHYFTDTVMYHRALADCVDGGIQVVNLSIGGTGLPDFNERRLFDALLSSGITVVAAMGNSRASGSPTSYPAAIPGVIAVGATNIKDEVASFSNRGSHIALVAPGQDIWSTLPTYPGQTGFQVRYENGKPVTGVPAKRDTDYATWDGTSMAAPHVAAAAALLHAKHPGIAPDQVLARLKASADKVPGMQGRAEHPDYGAGRLNLFRLLA